MDRDLLQDFLKGKIVDLLEANNLQAPNIINEETSLLGSGGIMDSLMLVELMLALEEFMNENGHEFSWANDSAMSQKRSPYRTLGSLMDHVLENQYAKPEV